MTLAWQVARQALETAAVMAGVILGLVLAAAALREVAWRLR